MKKKTSRPLGSNLRAGQVQRTGSAKQEPTESVVLALENPRYKWRTIEGLARDSGADLVTVQRVLKGLGETVVKSSIPSVTGQELFTTRRHLREGQSFLSRLGAILRNRAA